MTETCLLAMHPLPIFLLKAGKLTIQIGSLKITSLKYSHSPKKKYVSTIMKYMILPFIHDSDYFA